MQDRKEYKKQWRLKNIEREKEKKVEYYKQNKEAQRERDLQSKYKISLEDYNNMFVAQEGKCACCGISEAELQIKYDSFHARFCVDHDHQTNKVRQLLCHKCNTLIGYLEKRKDILGKALAYIDKHR